MKWYNSVMFILTVACVSVVILTLTGCANIQQMREMKQDGEYRKQLNSMSKGSKRDQLLLETVDERSYYEEVIRCDNYVSQAKREVAKERYGIELESDCEIEKVQRVRATPIEMPQEWLDQWPSLRDPKDSTEQFENGIIGDMQ